jgi:Leucine-rich repeat (LRR) protein
MRDLRIWAGTVVPLVLSLAACDRGALQPDPGGQTAPPTDMRPVGPTRPPCDQLVQLADPALDAVVHEAMGIPAGSPIPPISAPGLSELRADGMGIRSLAGIECFTGLQLLDLIDNQIMDISPVANLVNLTELDLNGNRVQSIAAVARLTKLTELELTQNLITDIRPLASLVNLERLGLTDNAINNVEPLRGLTRVRMLWIDGNAIHDIEPLTGMTNLGELTLSRNPVTNLSSLASIASLYSLTLADAPSADLSTLSSDTLVNIDLSHNTVATVLRLPPQSRFPNLVWISFSDSAFNDTDINRLLPVLRGLTVESLVVTDNQISNLAPFAQTHAGNLYFTNNRITDLSPILTFPSPPLLFVDVRTNPFDCDAQAATIHGAGPIYIYTDCP